MAFLRSIALFCALLPLAVQAAPDGPASGHGPASPEPATITTMGVALAVGVLVILRRKR